MTYIRPADVSAKLARRISKFWLTQIRETNPAILECHRDHALYPPRDLLPWTGEFAGKYLTGAAQIYRITGDEKLRLYVQGFIGELLSYQDENGYLGVYPSGCELTGRSTPTFDYGEGKALDAIPTWDSWAHYHIMVGLMLWSDILDDPAIMEAVYKIVRLFLEKFPEGGLRLVDTGSCEMNMAPYHGFLLLYNRCGKHEYLEFAHRLERQLSDPAAGDYLNYAKQGLDFWRCPKPRWESLHVILGFGEMYRATGDESYLMAARQIWESIQATDVHNTGAFSTDEQAIGNPFVNGKIETCCVIAYHALSAQIYNLTLDPAVADYLERCHYNAIMGYYSKSGRWSTYNTPMVGYKRANYHEIVFQSRPGSPDLNCCSVNAPRGIGDLCEWALVSREGIAYLNYYGAGEYAADGFTCKIEGAYPYTPEVILTIIDASCTALALRIPGWSVQTRVMRDSEALPCFPGDYLYIENPTPGEVLTLHFDFTPYVTPGEGAYEGMSSIYRGPLLFGCDASYCRKGEFDALPVIDLARLAEAEAIPLDFYGRPCSSFADAEGISLVTAEGVTLCDFYTLGQTGAPYTTWLRAGL